MQRERYIAVLTLWNPSTHLALYHRSKATPILKEDGLLPILQGLTNCSQELRRERTTHHLAMLQILDVYHMNFGQLNVLIACFQFHKSILALLGIIIALHRWSGCTQQSLGTIHLCQHDSRTSGMIARGRVLLLETRLMLFVYNHKPQFLKRQKYGTSCPQNDIIRMSGKLFLPYLHTLCITILRVIDAQAVSKYLVKTFHNLNRQGNLWQEIEHLLVFIKSLFDEMDIHFGLATRSDTMQEYHVLLHHLKENLIIGILLGHREWFYQVEMCLARCIQASHLQFISKKKSFVQERFNDSRSGMALIHKLFLGHTFHKRRSFVNKILHLSITSIDFFIKKSIRVYFILKQSVPMRKLKECHKSLGLFECSLHHTDGYAQSTWIAIFARQLHIKFHLGLIFLRRFQSRRKGGIINIAQGNHVILADPRPKAILLIEKCRSIIQHLPNRLHIKIWLYVMHLHCHGNIFLTSAQRHKQALAKHDFPFHPIRDRISKQAWERQRQYNVYISHQNQQPKAICQELLRLLPAWSTILTTPTLVSASAVLPQAIL